VSGLWHAAQKSMPDSGRYSDDELIESAPSDPGPGRRRDVTRVLLSSCYRDYAHRNAQQLEALIG